MFKRQNFLTLLAIVVVIAMVVLSGCTGGASVDSEPTVVEVVEPTEVPATETPTEVPTVTPTLEPTPTATLEPTPTMVPNDWTQEEFNVLWSQVLGWIVADPVFAPGTCEEIQDCGVDFGNALPLFEYKYGSYDDNDAASAYRAEYRDNLYELGLSEEALCVDAYANFALRIGWPGVLPELHDPETGRLTDEGQMRFLEVTMWPLFGNTAKKPSCVMFEEQNAAEYFPHLYGGTFEDTIKVIYGLLSEE